VATTSDDFLQFQGGAKITARLFFARDCVGYSYVSTLQEIKAAIPRLTLEERAEVARCLHGWQDDDWDEQMKRDLSSGKLDPLLKKVDDNIKQGDFSESP
jgi:hypothetical protein